jgi:hypothetical protein
LLLCNTLTLFGQVMLRLPRFRCAGYGGAEVGHGWPAHCRSTPELDQVRAQFSACMTYRVAASLLEHLLPIDAGLNPETLRACTLKVGEELRDAAPAEPATSAAAITLTLDSAFIGAVRTATAISKSALEMPRRLTAAGRCSLRSRKKALQSRC